MVESYVMKFAPSFWRCTCWKMFLVSLGPLAALTLRRLIEADARVRWFSQDIDVAEEIWLPGRPDQIEICFHEFSASDFEEAAAVVVMLDGPIANQISERARALGCLVAIV